MKIPWIKLIVAAITAEVTAILVLVCLVAIFGPKEASQAQVYAEKLGWWVGPIAGTVLSFIGAFWITRRLANDHLVQGSLFGLIYSLIDVALIIAMQPPFEWIFVVSNAGKITAGVLGGLVAGRCHRRNLPSST
ncbi:MAG: hypothetical protein ABIT76_06685 [Chthoniobacterales bacterium]